MKKGKSILSLILVIAVTALFGMTCVLGLDLKGMGAAKNINLGLDLEGGVSITYQVKGDKPSQADMDDTVYKLQKRVEQYSTEAQAYQVGDNRISIEIPGVSDANKILEELGQPGSLYFIKHKDSEGNENYSLTASGYTLNKSIDELKDTDSIVLTGTEVKTASAGALNDSTTGNKKYGVDLELTDEGAEKFKTATEEAYNNNNDTIAIYYDGALISVPKVNAVIENGKAQISGNMDYEEADNIASTIRIGGLNLELEELSSEVVGAQLGQDALKGSLIAGIIGLAIVCVFMCWVYLLPGLASSLALILYTELILILLNAFDITLTLPGIAGIILGIGMAVDANVIIYTRIREEIAAGKSVENSILAGYNKATSAIVDGNVTTLIAAIVLYIFGTGPVKGFATTLAVGNIVSIFTALVITKVIMKLLYNFGLTKPSMYGKTTHRRTYDILSIKKWTITVSIVLIVIGFITMGVQSALGNRALNFSLEFVGGSTTSFTFDKEYSQSEIENDIIPVIRDAAGITEVQQQKVQNSTKVSFKTTDLSLEQREAVEEAVTAKFPIEDGSIVETDTISSSVSSTMKKNAILSVILATIAMLIYIFARFRDIKFALAAVMALLQDVLVVITFYAVFRVPVGNTFIACMLTIVGYSINGTIIIFDRIREMLKSANSKTNITELVNSAITSTLTRNINTTITTLIMLVMLYILGVTSVKEFSLPLIVGIIVGFYSSVFLTSSFWYMLGGKNRGVIDEAVNKRKKAESIGKDGAQV